MPGRTEAPPLAMPLDRVSEGDYHNIPVKKRNPGAGSRADKPTAYL